MSRFRDFLSDDSGLIFVPILIGLMIGGAVSTGVEVTGNALNANDLNTSAKFTQETKNTLKVKAAELPAKDERAAEAIVNDLQSLENATREDAKTEVISGVKTVGKEALLTMIPGGKVGGSVIKAVAKQSKTVRSAINLVVKAAPAGSKAKEAVAMKELVGTVVLEGSGAQDAIEKEADSKLTAVENLLRGKKDAANLTGSALEDAITLAKLDAASSLVRSMSGKADPAAVNALAAEIVIDSERDKTRIKAADPRQDGAAGANALAEMWGKAKDAVGNPFMQRLQEALAKLQMDNSGGKTDAARAGVRESDLGAVKDGSASSAIGVVWAGGQTKPAILRKGAKGLEVVLPLDPGSPVTPLKDDLTLDVPSYEGTWSGTYGLRIDVPGYGSAVTEIPMSFTVKPDGTAHGDLSYNGPVNCPGLQGGASVTYKMSGEVNGKVTGNKMTASGPWRATATITVAGFSKSTPGNATVTINGTFTGNAFSGADQRNQKIKATRK